MQYEKLVENRILKGFIMPLISVIVPVYKVEKYIHKCVDSIIAQTFTDFELFLVDDGSPDNCGKICDEYAEKDNRIIVIHKENGGLSDARNVAIDKAKGEYLTFIDSDDYVSENHLETLYNALISTGSDIAIANISSFDDDGYNDEFYRPTSEVEVLENEEMFKTIYQPCAQSKLYKKYIFDDIRYPFGRLYEDFFVYHDVLAKANRLVLTGCNTYYYLLRSDSIMRQKYRLQFTDIIDALEVRIKKLEELGLRDLVIENRPFIYNRTAVAFANLDDSVAENMGRLKEIKDIYDAEYPKLMTETDNKKQKFRYWLLYKFPNIHSRIFGKNMSLVLG